MAGRLVVGLLLLLLLLLLLVVLLLLWVVLLLVVLLLWVEVLLLLLLLLGLRPARVHKRSCRRAATRAAGPQHLRHSRACRVS